MEGNNMKMREALEAILSILKGFDFDNQNAPTPDDLNCVHSAIAIAEAALSAPPRNCEVGTPDEKRKRFNEYCDQRVCESCDIYKRRHEACYSGCRFQWEQMPYAAERKGVTKDGE